MTELLNLTPHAIRIYSADTPDRIDDITHGLIVTIDPSGELARLNEDDIYPPARPVAFETYTDGVVMIPVRSVVFTSVYGLPSYRDNVRLIVPLITALAEHAEAPYRDDLLVPYGQIRNAEGAVVGCRSLARPC